MMPVKNNIFLGVLLGAILPAVAYLLTEVLFKGATFAVKPAAPYLIAVGINLFLLKFIYKNDADKTGTGVLLVSFLVVILTFIFKIKLR